MTSSGELAGDGPADLLHENRRKKLRDVVSKTEHQGLNVEQFVADIECIDVLKINRPEWIQRLEREAAINIRPATNAEFFTKHTAEKKLLQRIRDGLTALQKTFDAMPPDQRRALAREAFVAAQRTGSTADVALQALLATILEGIRGTISRLSASTPSSDADLHRHTKIVVVAAVFHKHRLSIGVGQNSPFIKVCSLVGVPRATVQKYLPDVKPNLDRHARDLYGE